MTTAGGNFRRELSARFVDGVPYMPVSALCALFQEMAVEYRDVGNPEAALAVERIAVAFDLGLIEAATKRAEGEAS